MDKPLLTLAQMRALETFFKSDWIRRYFYLTGGTALAGFHYGHRGSDDLDLFTHGVDLEPVPTLARDAAASLGVRLQEDVSAPSYRRFYLGELKVDFVRDVDFRVGSPVLLHGIMVDCVKNIAVNKVCAVYGRLDAKDYVDLHAILGREGYDILELLALARQKDAGVEPFQWAQVIADVGSLKAMPRMVEPLDRGALAAFYRALRDRILDRIRPG